MKQFLFLVLLICLSGCGLFQKPNRHYLGYFSPNWIDNESIIVSRQEFTEKTQSHFNDDLKEGTHNISKIEISSNENEEVIISTSTFDSEGSSPEWESIHAILYFPSGEDSYLIYISSDTNHTSNHHLLKFYRNKVLFKSVVVPRSTSSSNKLQYRLLKSPDKKHIAYSLNDEFFNIFTIDGNLLKENLSGGYVAWRDNNVVLFYHRSENKLAEFNLSLDSASIYTHSFIPAYYDSALNSISGIKDGFLKKYDITKDSIEIIKELNVESQSLNNIKFSPNGANLLLSKEGYFDDITNKTSLGIYIYDLQTDQITKIRD